MNTINDIVVEMERKKMLKQLDWTSNGLWYEGEVEALAQTLLMFLKQPGVSETNQGVLET